MESAAYSPRSSSNANSLWRRALAEPTQVVTESQIHGSHADSRVRVLRGQPRSPVSARQKVNVARTMSSERARGCCCACFVFALQWKPLIIVGRRLFNQASYACPVETLLRLRRGPEVLIKMPADGRGNVRE